MSRGQETTKRWTISLQEVLIFLGWLCFSFALLQTTGAGIGGWLIVMFLNGMVLFRPRFSVRTVAVIVMLVCAYLGAWQATKWGGARQNERTVAKLQATFPRQNNIRLTKAAKFRSAAPFVLSRTEHSKRCYYVWLCGVTIKLPFESRLD